MICLRHLVFNEALENCPSGTSWGGGTWELAVIIDSLK